MKNIPFFSANKQAIELRYKRQTICSSEITKIQKESRLCERGFAIEWICEVSCQTWFNHIQSDFSRCTSLVVKEGGKRKQTFAHVRRKSGHKEDTVFIGEYMSFSHHLNSIILTRCKELDDFCHLKFYYFQGKIFPYFIFVIKTSDHVMICSFFLSQFIRTLYKLGGGGGIPFRLRTFSRCSPLMMKTLRPLMINLYGNLR